MQGVFGRCCHHQHLLLTVCFAKYFFGENSIGTSSFKSREQGFVKRLVRMEDEEGIGECVEIGETASLGFGNCIDTVDRFFFEGGVEIWSDKEGWRVDFSGFLISLVLP